MSRNRMIFRMGGGLAFGITLSGREMEGCLILDKNPKLSRLRAEAARRRMTRAEDFCSGLYRRRIQSIASRRILKRDMLRPNRDSSGGEMLKPRTKSGSLLVLVACFVSGCAHVK